MTDYTATARREGRWWVVQCVEEPNAITQVARLDQVDEYLRESLAFVTGTTEEAIGTIRVIPDIPELGQQLDDLRRLQQGATEIDNTARALNRRIAESLTAAGLTIRDVGAVLGVSYQRAHQIIADAKATPRPLDGDALRTWTAALEEVLAVVDAEATTPDGQRRVVPGLTKGGASKQVDISATFRRIHEGLVGSSERSRNDDR